MVMIVAIENADLQITGTIRTKTSQTVMVVKLSVASRTRIDALFLYALHIV